MIKNFIILFCLLASGFYFYKNKSKDSLIIVSLITIIYLFSNNKKEFLDKDTSLNEKTNLEKLQILASMYNGGTLNIPNLKVNGNMEVVGNLDVDENLNVLGKAALVSNKFQFDESPGKDFVYIKTNPILRIYNDANQIQFWPNARFYGGQSIGTK